MTRAPSKPDPRGRDGLEPPGVAAGRLVGLLAAVVIVAILSAAALWGAFLWRAGRPSSPSASGFPAPRLETNQTPRLTVGTSHGPGSYRLTPPEERSGETASADSALEAAMQAEARRGAAAYDPAQAQSVGS